MTTKNLVLLVGRRVAALAILLIIISLGVFTLLYLAPGSIEQILLGTHPSTPATLQAIREYYNLDQPFLTQYWHWAAHALHGDFGRSTRTSQPVTEAIGSAASITIFLGLYGFAISLVSGVTLGVWSALRSRTIVDRGIVGASVIGVSAPAFATGIFLLYVFAVVLKWFPAYGPGNGFFDRLYHLTLPAIALALTGTALIIKLTRAAMITTLEQDYVTFARARGISPARIVFAYGLRNALIPVVTASGLILGYMVTGAVLVEATFTLPGLGALLVDAVNYKDVPVVQALALIVASLIVVVNLLTDIAYLVVDPRVRFSRGPS
jgi:peptide/nickel transport system permease protein